MQPAGKRTICLAALFFWISSASHGQCLGEAARQQRQKQQQKQQAKKEPLKVITNEDLPEHAEHAANDSGSTDQTHAASVPAAGAKTAEQWRSEIEAQQQSVASLQAEIDRLNSSIHFVDGNRYSNGARYNQRQEQKQEQVQRMQEQLDQQRKKLEAMQEGARKDGFGTAVYDP